MDNQEKKEPVVPVKVNKTVLTQQVFDGMKKKELADHYGLSVVKMGELLKQAGLTIRKFHAKKFVLVDDEQEDVVKDVASSDEAPKEEPEVLVDNNPVATATDDVKEDEVPIEEQKTVWEN